MKVYFLIIIIVLVIVILLLFYLLYKIYILHIKAYEDGYYEDEEEKRLTDEVDAVYPAPVESSQESISTKTGSSSITEDTNTSAVQPQLKSVFGPIFPSIPQDLKLKNGTKERCSATVLVDYNSTELKLWVTLLEVANLQKAKSGSSEAYVDMQLTPYKHRTYRPPGYRRPLRGCLKRPVDFSLDHEDLRTHYFLLFILRYDPFSRLKVEGEAMIQLSEIEELIDGKETTVTRELVDSEQQFTGFIFRQGSGSTRSLNGSTRSHNGSTRSHNGSTRSHNGSTRSSSNPRRSLEDNLRGSTRSFNGFSRSHEASLESRNESSKLADDTTRDSPESFTAFAKPRIESPVLQHGLTRFTDDKMRESSRSFSGAIGSRNCSTPPPSRLLRSHDEYSRQTSRSFSGFSRPRNASKLPPSGLTRSTDEKHLQHDDSVKLSRGLMRFHDEAALQEMTATSPDAKATQKETKYSFHQHFDVED